MWNRIPVRPAGGRAQPIEPPHVEREPAGGEAPLAQRLQAALDGIEEAIVVCDAEGRAVFRNQAAGQLLSGRPTEALVDHTISEILRDALAGERPERRLDLISPVRRSLSIRAFPTGSPAVDGAVVVVEDISERLRLEAVRRDFVANVSHELKTPTGALALLAETIDGETDPEVVARLARRMGGEAERLSRIIDDLLDLSRIEANEKAPGTDLVPVGRLVNEAVEPLLAVAAGRGVTIDVGEVPGDLAVSGNGRDLVSAVANLVDNAVKYSEPAGIITVNVSREDSKVAISVADRGIGIPGRDLERIFERFYRVDRARSRDTGGTGLGLSIVRHVAANHGGAVRVSSVEGEGSTFVLELPAVPVSQTGQGEGAHDDGHD